MKKEWWIWVVIIIVLVVVGVLVYIGYNRVQYSSDDEVDQFGIGWPCSGGVGERPKRCTSNQEGDVRCEPVDEGEISREVCQCVCTDYGCWWQSYTCRQSERCFAGPNGGCVPYNDELEF